VVIGPLPAAALPAGLRPAAPGQRPVLVMEYAGEKPRREFLAARARVRAAWDRFNAAPLVTVTLVDVNVRYAGEPPETGRHRDEYALGPYAVPADIVAACDAIPPEELLGTGGRSAAFPNVADMVSRLRGKVVANLRAKVAAEIHQRLAYGISCLMMVLLGAALGLVFRGGQMVAAFAISAVPASLVIMLLLMGRQLIANPGVPALFGIATIWGGVSALTLATGYVYAVHMRK
jgi:hypothetical protein